MVAARSATTMRAPSLANTMTALFSVCGHLQDPALYQPSCVGRCIAGPGGHGLVACDDFAPGTLLTLFPIHAFGCAEVTEVGSTVEETAVRLYLPLLDEATYPYPAFLGRRADLFVDAAVGIRVPGWQAHLADVGHADVGVDRPETRANCMTVPLGGAAPLAALVATTHIRSGEALLVDGSTLCRHQVLRGRPAPPERLGWPRLPGAWGSLRRDLPLKEASGEPAG